MIKYHTLKISPALLELVWKGKKTVELRCGNKYTSVLPGDVLRYQNSLTGKDELLVPVHHLEQYKNYYQFEAVRKNDNGFHLTNVGFDSWSHLRVGLEGFYPCLEAEPFVVFYLGEG